MNLEVKKYLVSNRNFKKVFVKGEVSKPSISRKGHLYFTLKDEKSTISCVAFYRVQSKLPFQLEDGMQVLITGEIGVFVERGEYELIANSITEDGLGQLYVALEQLKRKLSSEGLFDVKFKKSLPLLPKRIGVITSPNGDGLKDIIKVIGSKSYPCEILIFPSLVQGKESVENITRQIKHADEYDLDCLIVGRGGGSAEDLWSFNSELVVRAVFECKTPVISAVGHQNDSTLIDRVADVCASTPTDAATKIVNQFADAENSLNHKYLRLFNVISKSLVENKNNFELILSNGIFKNPKSVYESQFDDFEKTFYRFRISSEDLVKNKGSALTKIKQEYVIRRPCKIQLDQKKHNLNELKNRLIDAMNSIINADKVNLDKVADNFKFQSKNLLSSKRHSLEIYESYLKTNPCHDKINTLQKDLLLNKINLNREMDLKIKNNRKDLNVILDKSIFKNPKMIYLNKYNEFRGLFEKFTSKSNVMILTKSHELDSFKNAPVIKNHLEDYLISTHNQLNGVKSDLKRSFRLKIDENNKDFSFVLNSNVFESPETLYESKNKELNKIKKSKVIENPYMMLDGYKQELKIYEEKLDKINQVITLKKEQQKQKRIYLGIIAAIVIAVILIIIFGGIL